MAPKLSQQVIPLGGIGALQTAEVAQIMAFPHEFRRRELHRRPRRRGETRCYLRKAGHEADRRDDKSAADRWADRLAERADVDDPPGAIEPHQRWRSPARSAAHQSE